MARLWISALCLRFAVFALCAGRAVAQIEGPLDNDSYLPIAATAEAELAHGDQAFAEALRISAAGDAHSISAAWTSCCEAWRNALLRSEVGDSAGPHPVAKPGDVSPWPASEGNLERYTEGIEESVFRRLTALPKAGQLVWNERFDALALEQLLRAGSAPSSVARVERNLPATPAASRAALLLAELAFESGDGELARRWLARARRHIALFGLAEVETSKGIELRERLLPPAPTPIKAAWERATQLEAVAGRALEDARGQPARTRAIGAGPQAGMAFLGGDRALLQTPSALWILSGATAELTGPFENNAWLSPAGFGVDATIAPGNGPGWRLDPAVQASSAVVVAGRSLAGRANVLARIDIGAGGEEPTLRWAQAAGPKTPGTSRSENGDDFEFQPGPLWTEGLVIALVRRANSTSGEREMELRALDPNSGALRWSTYLGKGGERVRDMGRFARRGAPSQPAEPLLRTSTGIFASAQLGFGALIDPLDGRALFSVRNRRRPAEERGWTGWGACLCGDGSAIAWAPADSDRLYLLDVAGPGKRGTPLLATPAALGEAEALVQGDSRQALVLARSGARAALSRWDLNSGAREDALRLGPEEVFSGRALAGDQRVIAASDRALYLFDRSADLALLAAEPLNGPIPRGGNVWARDSRIFVLSNRYVEVFSAR